MVKKLIALTALSPFIAFAEPQIYAGPTLGYYTLKEDGFGAIEPNFVTLGAKLGAKVNEFFSAEARISRGLIEDEATVSGITFETELEHLAGVYLKVHAGDRFQPYLMLGFTQVSIGIDASDGSSSASTSETETDTAFGFGVDFYATEKVAINGECASLYDKDDSSVTGCSAGVSFFF